MTLLLSPTPYDDATRQALIDLLNPLTLDTIAIGLAAWRAHRSLSGPYFSALHPLFQAFAERLDKLADKLPEFVAMLGGQPVGLADEVAEGTRIDPYPRDTTDGIAHCRELFDRAQALSAYLGQGITAANELGAADALDLLTKAQEHVNYYGWQIGRHFAPTAGATEMT